MSTKETAAAAMTAEPSETAGEQDAARHEGQTVRIEAVNHPSHYNSGKIETIRFIALYTPDFWTGNAAKYISRAGKKPGTPIRQDLEKALWYITDACAREKDPASRTEMGRTTTYREEFRVAQWPEETCAFSEDDYCHDQGITGRLRDAIRYLAQAAYFPSGSTYRLAWLHNAGVEIRIYLEELASAEAILIRAAECVTGWQAAAEGESV